MAEKIKEKLGWTTMQQVEKDKINIVNNEIVHNTVPDSDIRIIVRKILDVNDDGVVDTVDIMFILKYMIKWILIITGIVFVLIDKSDGQLNIYTTSGWITIVSVIATNAYKNYMRKKDSEEYISIIFRYKDLILKFIDLLNKLMHKSETDDINLMIKDFVIRIKDELARIEMSRNDTT